ncbi:hypothetical protein E3N88_38222 [Mikania micrantha]|uniref:Piwi domain-containing protein n=1 Tax=Mikania micrantha TaxID=192012 RepID=A0A5N6LU57_9ASTR|nr:hypothetical protein E3N88_38222 [Mikania micrantha]
MASNEASPPLHHGPSTLLADLRWCECPSMVLLSTFTIYVTDRSTIIFGADVTHPSLGEDSIPYIAAVCCYVFAFVLIFRWLLQWIGPKSHKQDIIKDLYTKNKANHAGLIR